MITLITGGPGTGKTAWLLNQLLDLRKIEPDKELYIHGVRNLRGIAHEQIFCKSQLCDICRAQDKDQKSKDVKFVEDWPQWKVTGSLIIIDEVQRIWRPRTGGTPPPESVSGLETHRHYGLDFWLISQGPHLFDNAIRLLVGRHIHLVAKWSGRTEYEWPECKQDVQSRSDAVIRPYSLPKRVYSLYDSAELHTKQNKRKPISFYALIVAGILALTLGYTVFSRIKAKMTPPVIEVVESGGGALATPSDSTTINPVNIIDAYPDFTPRIPGVAETAPAYAKLIQVKAVPLLAGCVLSSKGCKCYTSQATPYPSTDLYCREVVNNHRFNPYLAERRQDKIITAENKQNGTTNDVPIYK